eukprot:4251677-Pyramimonas_sp.AAC.1
MRLALKSITAAPDMQWILDDEMEDFVNTVLLTASKCCTYPLSVIEEAVNSSIDGVAARRSQRYKAAGRRVLASKKWHALQRKVSAADKAYLLWISRWTVYSTEAEVDFFCSGICVRDSVR